MLENITNLSALKHQQIGKTQFMLQYNMIQVLTIIVAKKRLCE